MMNKDFFQELVSFINEHATWIHAEYSERRAPSLVVNEDLVSFIYSGTILLRAFHPLNGYAKGQKWIVTEYELEKNARRIRAGDEKFWKRLISLQFTTDDVERLILESTHRLVKLQLA